MYFTTPNTGYLITTRRKIYKTTNRWQSIGIEPISAEIPERFSLSQNYPNPFNPSTKIKFDIPAVGNAYMRSVQLKIFDILGKEITTLVNQPLQAGKYEVEWNASNHPSSIYFYTLVTETFSETKRMVLLK